MSVTIVNRVLACSVALVCCLLSSAVSGAATDVYTVMIDGRPLSDNPKDVGAVRSRQVVYVDAVLMTKAFSGLLTFHQGGKVLVISIEQRNATFTAGHSSGSPFIYNGDMFVAANAFARFTRSKISIDPKGRVVAFTTTHPPAH